MIVEDVCESPIFVGTEALDVQLRAGIQAVQSTPLIGRSGTPLGMISTHWRTRHRPGEAVLRLLDVLAREVSDVTEHVQAEADQRRTETEQRFLAEASAALASLEYEETLRNVARVALSAAITSPPSCAIRRAPRGGGNRIANINVSALTIPPGGGLTGTTAVVGSGLTTRLLVIPGLAVLYTASGVSKETVN